jgi:WD40 repeat protein
VPALTVLLSTAMALAQFGTNKVTYQAFDWQVYEAPHFDIHYYPEMEPFLEEIVSVAESAYLKLSKALDHELRYRVPLIVYKTHGEFQQTNILFSEVGDYVGGFSEPLQNRMVLPIDLPPEKLYQLVSHELVHIFEYSLFYDGYLGRIFRSNPPGWLMEGLASYLGDDEDNLDRMWIRDAVVNGQLPTVQSLSIPTFAAYRFGHAIFDFIEQEHGPEGLRSFLFEYRKVLLSNNIEKAIKESFGYDVNTFNRNFERYLRKKYYPILLEKKSPDDYGKEIGIKQPGAPTFSPTISPSGELVAALGSTGRELDLFVLSVEGGRKVRNLTKGYTNKYRNLVTEVIDGKRDLSWSPTADQVAVFGRRENKWPLMIFNAVNGKRMRDIPFKDIVQCASPVFSPDGKRVAFEGNRNGIVDIFEVDLETKAVRNLTQDMFFDSNPWYSADGKTLVYNRRIGSYRKIFTVDLADPEKKAQLTFGPTSDIQPSLSPDGKTVYFSSDRGADGVYNIYSLDLATADVRQFTDVVGGCFSAVEMSERSGDRNLVFTAYFEGTYRLYRMPLKEPEQIIPAEERFAEPIDVEPFEPPLSLRVDESQKRPYKLQWDIDPPYLEVGVTNDGTFLGAGAIGFSDLLGNHRVQIVASSIEQFANFNVQYSNRKRRFTWGTSLYDFRDFFVRQDGSGNIDRDLTSRLTGIDGFIHYPLSRHYRITTSVGVMENEQDFIGLDGDGLQVPRTFKDQFASFNVGIVGDTTRYQYWWPIQGKRFNFSTWYAPHISGDDPTESGMWEHRADFRSYKQLTRRSVLAFRFRGIWNSGDRQSAYAIGGINQIRGYEYRDFVGSRLFWSNLELRFPLVDMMSFAQGFLNIFQMRGVLFIDVGAAYYGHIVRQSITGDFSLVEDAFYDPNLNRIRVDAANNVVPFDFWNSDQGELQDGRGSYGVGFNFLLFGALQLNWVWARPMDHMQWSPATQDFVKVKSSTVKQFYIAFDF